MGKWATSLDSKLPSLTTRPEPIIFVKQNEERKADTTRT